jgi:hypothetical protein
MDRKKYLTPVVAKGAVFLDYKEQINKNRRQDNAGN